MTVAQLYEKLSPAQRQYLHLVANRLIYNDGTNAYTFYVDNSQDLISADVATFNWLKSLGG